MYVYACDHDLRAVEPAYNQLGGKEPSSIIEAGELITELERIAPAISSTEPSGENFRNVNRALTALNELRKLLRSDRARMKGIREQHARYTQIRQQLLDTERAARGNAPFVIGPYQPVTIEREARHAHVAWLKRGREGTGRMEVVGARMVGERFHAEDVTAGRFERTHFGNDVGFTKFVEAEFVECVLEGAAVGHAHFTRAKLTSCSFDRAYGPLADFSHALIERCSFDDAVLTEAHWD